MKASAIIPNHRSERTLPATLRSLEAAARGLDVEIIVSDDEAGRGLSWARNRGLDRATGDVVFFVDADDTIDAKEVFLNYAEMPTRAKGPTKVDSRYISEDVPQGLVMLEALGKALDIATPICTALIEIASAALGRDLRAEGRTPEKLGRENIHRILRDCGKEN